MAQLYWPVPIREKKRKRDRWIEIQRTTTHACVPGGARSPEHGGDGGDAAGMGVPGDWGLLGMNVSHLDGRGGVARSVARRRASTPLLLPGIPRRSWRGRRSETVVEVSVDLASKRAPIGVKAKEQGEGKETGCRGEARVAGVGRGVRIYRRQTAASRAPIRAAWRRAG